MINETEIEANFEWLRDNETAIAEARAHRVWCEEYRKSLKAILMAQCDEKAAAQKEIYAYAHVKYLRHIDTYREAVTADEALRAKVSRIHLMIEFWRSRESSRRALGSVG